MSRSRSRSPSREYEGDEDPSIWPYGNYIKHSEAARKGWQTRRAEMGMGAFPGYGQGGYPGSRSRSRSSSPNRGGYDGGQRPWPYDHPYAHSLVGRGISPGPIGERSFAGGPGSGWFSSTPREEERHREAGREAWNTRLEDMGEEAGEGTFRGNYGDESYAWYGEPLRHSEAAREGWNTRRERMAAEGYGGFRGREGYGGQGYRGREGYGGQGYRGREGYGGEGYRRNY